MTIKSTIHWRRHNRWPVLLAGLLSACGSETAIIALVEVVTPLGGNWDASNFTESLDFNQNLPQNVLFASDLDVTATVTTATGVCSSAPAAVDIPVTGTLINGNLVLRPANQPNTPVCLLGQFTDLITLEAGPPGGTVFTYQNTRVDVQLSLGLWVSKDNGQLKLKFEAPDSVDNNDVNVDVSGCDVSSPTIAKFEGEMNGFNTTTNTNPSIPELRPVAGGAPLFTQIEFKDGATLTMLDASGQPVTLLREPDSANTVCPP